MLPTFGAMTARDLTVFLCVDMDAGDDDGGVGCRIGDLDVEAKGAAKEAYWHDTEREMIERDWYYGGEVVSSLGIIQPRVQGGPGGVSDVLLSGIYRAVTTNNCCSRVL